MFRRFFIIMTFSFLIFDLKGMHLNQKYVSDTTLFFKRTKEFFEWYKIKYDLLVNNKFVSLIENDTNYYRIDFREVDKYINILKNSKFFSSDFLIEKKQYFDSIDQDLTINRQNVLPIYGLSYDLLLYTQDLKELLNNTNKMVFKISKIEKNFIYVQVKYFYFEFEFKYNKNFVIEKISPIPVWLQE